jgi:hypothetical protein
MSLDALIILFGAVVAGMPFLGFTVDMQKWIIFVLGLIVIALGVAVRRRGQAKPPARRRRGEFVESSPVELSNRGHADVSGAVGHQIEDNNDNR